MQLFSFLSEFLTSFEEWIFCTCIAVLPVLWFIACCPLHTKRIFRIFSTLLVLVSFALLGCAYPLKDALLFSVLIVAECFLLDKLILPRPQKKKEAQKVVCFEEKPLVTQIAPPEIASHSLDETDVCLDHAFEIASRLKSMPLSGSDRLETDNVELALRMYRAKGVLTDREMRSLNDCLAVLLKLTAKYEG